MGTISRAGSAKVRVITNTSVTTPTSTRKATISLRARKTSIPPTSGRAPHASFRPRAQRDTEPGYHRPCPLGPQANRGRTGATAGCRSPTLGGAGATGRKGQGELMPPIEQIKLKRAGLGLRGCDPDRACPGYTLFAPMIDARTVYLIDLQGEVVHTWEMPYPPGLYGYLTPDGTLIYNGKVLEDPARFISEQPWKGGALLEMDWRGRVLWEVRHPDHHHDGVKLRNGNAMLLCLAPLPSELAAQVRGGMPGTERTGAMYADYLVEMTI